MGFEDFVRWVTNKKNLLSIDLAVYWISVDSEHSENSYVPAQGVSESETYNEHLCMRVNETMQVAMSEHECV